MKQLTSYIEYYIDKKGMRKAEAAQRTGLDILYAYQLLSGKRKPTFNNMIQLCYGLRLEEEEARRLCKAAGYSNRFHEIRDILYSVCWDE